MAKEKGSNWIDNNNKWINEKTSDKLDTEVSDVKGWVEEILNQKIIKKLDKKNHEDIKNDLLNSWIWLNDEIIYNILDLLSERVVISKYQILELGGAISEYTTDRIIDRLKKDWRWIINILVDKKTIIDNDWATNFYYIKKDEELNNKNDYKKWFNTLNSGYRIYFIKKLEEKIDEFNDINSIENNDEFFRRLSWLLEFPKWFTKNIIHFLEKFNYIKIKWNKISINNFDDFNLLKSTINDDWVVEIKWDIFNYISEVFRNNKDLKIKDFKNYFSKNYWLNLSIEDLKLIKEMIEKSDWEEISSMMQTNLTVIKSQKKYNIENWNYVLKFKVKDENDEDTIITKTYSIDIIDEIFYLYSKRWQNLTWTQVIEYLKIDQDFWDRLKNRLNIRKVSDVFWPHTLEMFWKDERFREDYIKKFSEKYIRDKTRKEIEQKRKKEDEKTIKEAYSITHSIDWFKKNLSDIINHPHFKIKKAEFKLYEQLPEYTNERIMYKISDLHLWKWWTDLIKDRLNQILVNAINRPEKNIDLFILWDLFEVLVQQWMHPGQLQTLDSRYIKPYEIYIEVYSILKNFMLEIAKHGKIVSFYWMLWNHDRITQSKWDDIERFWWKALYFTLEESFSHFNNINVDFQKEFWNSWASFPYNWFHFIAHHWDNWADKKIQIKSEKILIENTNIKKWVVNILVHGDKHNLKIANPSYNIYTISLPALWWKWDYDTSLWLSSNPWYITLEKDRLWDDEFQPIISTRMFKDELQENYRKRKSTEIFS